MVGQGDEEIVADEVVEEIGVDEVVEEIGAGEEEEEGLEAVEEEEGVGDAVGLEDEALTLMAYDKKRKGVRIQEPKVWCGNTHT